MAKKVSQDINQIFDDLDKLRDFCRDHGFRFIESDLYNPRMFVWQQYTKFINGKNCKNNWDDEISRVRSGYKPKQRREVDKHT